MSRLYCPQCGSSRDQREFMPGEHPICFECYQERSQRVPLVYSRSLAKAQAHHQAQARAERRTRRPA